MPTTDKLSVEEQAILAFVKQYLERKRKLHALDVVNNGEIEYVRAIIDGYRELYEREGRRQGQH